MYSLTLSFIVLWSYVAVLELESLDGELFGRGMNWLMLIVMHYCINSRIGEL